MPYLITNSGTFTGIQSIGNITYAIGNNLQASKDTDDSTLFNISTVSGIWEERFDDVDYYDS